MTTNSEPPPQLTPDKPFLKQGENVRFSPEILVTRRPDGEGIVQVEFLRIIPANKTDWEFEIRPVGDKFLRFKAEKTLVTTGVVDVTEETRSGFVWLEQAYEIRDRNGKVLHKQ